MRGRYRNRSHRREAHGQPPRLGEAFDAGPCRQRIPDGRRRWESLENPDFRLHPRHPDPQSHPRSATSSTGVKRSSDCTSLGLAATLEQSLVWPPERGCADGYQSDRSGNGRPKRGGWRHRFPRCEAPPCVTDIPTTDAGCVVSPDGTAGHPGRVTGERPTCGPVPPSATKACPAPAERNSPRTGSQRPEAGRCHRAAMPPDSRAGAAEAGPCSRRSARSARPALPLPPHPPSLGKGLQPGIRLVCRGPQFQSCPVAGGHAIVAPRRIGPVGARSCAQGLVRCRPCR